MKKKKYEKIKKNMKKYEENMKKIWKNMNKNEKKYEKSVVKQKIFEKQKILKNWKKKDFQKIKKIHNSA